MGVQGLLGLAAPASRPVHVAELRGHVVAVDSYCWLHRGAFAAQPGAHVKYCMKYINMLLSHNIKPILVFDGRHLPAKAITEEKRRESRNVAKTRAAELMRLGKIEEAKSKMRQCIDITHEMALDLIRVCRKMNVDCIVAPYEADAQLAYLNIKKIADVVITEDSDLLLFGCDKVIFKMDVTGRGVLIESFKLPTIMKCPLERYSFSKFRQMCILSGCDYLPSLPGIGLVKARSFINATRDPDISNALKKLPSFLNKNGLTVTDEYRKKFLIAEATFKHQLVYDPLKRKMVPLIELEDEGTDPQYCCNAGALLDSDVAFQLALGNIDPFTLEKMDDWNPDDLKNVPTGGKTNSWKQPCVAPHKSIWSKDYMDSVRIVEKKEDTINAIIIPSTRPLSTKIMKTKTKIDEGITIKELSAMYCVEPPLKKKRIVIPETQDVEDDSFTDCSNVTTDTLCNDDDSFYNKSDNDTSPILKRNNTTYKRLKENGIFNKYKNISKFKRTIVDDNDIVQSKFFDTYTPESMTDSQKENSYVEADDKSIIVNNTSIDQHVKRDDSFTNVSIEMKSLLNDSNVESNKKLIELSPFKSKNNVDCKNPFRIQRSIIEPQNEIEELCSTNILQIQPEIKINTSERVTLNKSVIKNNVCRRPGLQKKKIVPIAGQQSLLTVFGFQKKSQLKHSN